MSELEEVATRIEYDLPRRLRAKDDATDAWFRNATAEMAAAFRALKKWVLTPMVDTREQFIAYIATSFTSVASGDWHNLERTKLEKVSGQVWRIRLVELLRTLLVATIPLLVLMIIQQTQLALEGAPAEYVTAGVLIWAALTLISVFDPLFGEKIDALKDVAQLLPFISKDKK